MNIKDSLKPFLCLLESSDSVMFVNIELLTDVLFKSSVRLDISSFGLIGNAYASLCDSANLMFSGSFSVSIGISFPYHSLTYQHQEKSKNVAPICTDRCAHQVVRVSLDEVRLYIPNFCNFSLSSFFLRSTLFASILISSSEPESYARSSIIIVDVSGEGSRD